MGTGKQNLFGVAAAFAAEVGGRNVLRVTGNLINFAAKGVGPLAALAEGLHSTARFLDVAVAAASKPAVQRFVSLLAFGVASFLRSTGHNTQAPHPSSGEYPLGSLPALPGGNRNRVSLAGSDSVNVAAITV